MHVDMLILFATDTYSNQEFALMNFPANTSRSTPVHESVEPTSWQPFVRPDPWFSRYDEVNECKLVTTDPINIIGL